MLYTARVEVSTVQPSTARNTLAPGQRRRSAVGGSGRAAARVGTGMYRCISLVQFSVSSRFCTVLNLIPVRSTFRKYVSTKRGRQDATSTRPPPGPPGTSSTVPASDAPRASPSGPRAGQLARRYIVGCRRGSATTFLLFLIWISTCVRLQLSRLEGLGVGWSAVRRSPSPRLGWEPGASVCCCGWRRCPQRRRTRRAC